MLDDEFQQDEMLDVRTIVPSLLRALAKKAPPQKDWLDLNQAIREVIAMARNEVTQNRVSLQTQLANDLPFLIVL
jgi:hypothetical protein